MDQAATVMEVSGTPDNLYAFSAKTINGDSIRLDLYAGKVVLVVNVASKCGYTKQYEGLEALYRKYKDRGFVILGFPCNQFGGQEPGSEAEIAQFCKLNYGVSFPMFAKIHVNGEKVHPLYKWLKTGAPGLLGTEAIKWNFTKFLVDPRGKVVARYASKDLPSDLGPAIEQLLKQK